MQKEVATADHGKEDCTVSPASFRDPSGFVFTYNGAIYRQVNQKYREQYELLISSGLYARLTARSMLIPHKEVNGPVVDESVSWRIIRPEAVAFVSYPYEWSFSQMKDAALLMLDIQRLALSHGMQLKDASAYNIQFHKGQPVMIDTLSFERYTEGMHWPAYRQFCQHFLAPLALMANVDARLNRLLTAYIDGIPLDLASSLLPRANWLKAGLLMHLHLHAMAQKKYASSATTKNSKPVKGRHISKKGYTGIIQSLRKTVQKLNWQPGGTEWGDYYHFTNYSQNAFEEKKEQVKAFLEKVRPDEVWDLGGNTGVFSRIATGMGIPTVSFDLDHGAVDMNYRRAREEQSHLLLPLLLDLTNPSPGLGWEGNERDSFVQRGPVDCVMALALIHHLAIANNLPIEKIACFFLGLCKNLIIEFVPKEDSQVQRLLGSREDVFQSYNRLSFEAIFSRYFKVIEANQISGSERTLYLMEPLDK